MEHSVVKLCLPGIPHRDLERPSLGGPSTCRLPPVCSVGHCPADRHRVKTEAGPGAETGWGWGDLSGGQGTGAGRMGSGDEHPEGWAANRESAGSGSPAELGRWSDTRRSPASGGAGVAVLHAPCLPAFSRPAHCVGVKPYVLSGRAAAPRAAIGSLTELPTKGGLFLIFLPLLPSSTENIVSSLIVTRERQELCRGSATTSPAEPTVSMRCSPRYPLAHTIDAGISRTLQNTLEKSGQHRNS